MELLKKFSPTMFHRSIAASTCILQTSEDLMFAVTALNIVSQTEKSRASQTAKRLFKKEKDKENAFLAYRSTPLSCGYPPAELLMSRKISTTVPIFHEQLSPKLPNRERLQEYEAKSKLYQMDYFKSRHCAMSLPKLAPGIEVHILTYLQPGIVKSPIRKNLANTKFKLPSV